MQIIDFAQTANKQYTVFSIFASIIVQPLVLFLKEAVHLCSFMLVISLFFSIFLVYNQV